MAFVTLTWKLLLLHVILIVVFTLLRVHFMDKTYYNNLETIQGQNASLPLTKRIELALYQSIMVGTLSGRQFDPRTAPLRFLEMLQSIATFVFSVGLILYELTSIQGVLKTRACPVMIKQ